MKKFTIIAKCLCGCQSVTLWHVKARTPKNAVSQFKKDQDSDWPLDALVIMPGHLCLSDTPVRKYKP